jgi:tRNA threonylcarbamoyladenosine biosynthesis protein TsaB
MKILAVDTSSASGSVAFTEDGRVIAEESAERVGMHGAWLSSAIERSLGSAGVQANDVDLFAVSVGPGSFTGLRVGVSTVKGLSWALGKPVAGVSTLKALALNMSDSALPICAVLDARKHEIYAAVYKPMGASIETLLEERAVKPIDLIAELKERSLDNAIFTGSGLDPYLGVFKDGLPSASFALPALWMVKASNVARLTANGDAAITTAALLKPVYLRRSEAEINKKAASRCGGGLTI